MTNSNFGYITTYSTNDGEELTIVTTPEETNVKENSIDTYTCESIIDVKIYNGDITRKVVQDSGVSTLAL